MLDGFWGFRPLAWDTFAALVNKHVSVSLASVQLGKILRDHDSLSIEPRTSTDSTAGIRWLITIVGIPFYAQVGVPRLLPETCCGSQLLTNTIRSA